MPKDALTGRRILVVEDEYFLADELDRAVEAAGAVVIGPVPSVEAALDLLVGEEAPDAAVLDVNLGGALAYPVADALLERGVPFVFTTGYDQSSLPERFAAMPRLQKPAETRVILGEVRQLLGAA